MINKNLYQEVLMTPVESGATELRIVSGYASASMAHRHLGEELLQEKGVGVQLVYGMAGVDGVSLADDSMFAQLQGGHSFQCHYRVGRPTIHSKVYVWLREGQPVQAFVGSANYTQRGFLAPVQQQESMTEADPEQANDFFLESLRGSLEVGHEDIEQRVILFSPRQSRTETNDCVTLSLLNNRGNVPDRSGLNWGQRKGRNKNQAYLGVPKRIAETEFFPDRATQFTVLTDDGLSFIAVVAQDNDKAIETPDGNHILGEYFRRRLGVQLGSFVTRSDLDRYGRTNVEFCKLDNETFLMDFSVQS